MFAVSITSYADIRVDDGFVPDYASSVEPQGEFALQLPFFVKRHTIDNKYVITLKDEPLVTYSGGVQGLSATSKLGSKNTNVTTKGRINTKSLASKAYVDHLAGKQAETALHIGLKVKRDIEVVSKYRISHNGFSTHLSPAEAELVKSLPDVASVEKVEMVYLDTDSGPKYAGATLTWAEQTAYQGSKGEGVIVGIIDSGIGSFLEPVNKEFVADLLPGGDRNNLPSFHPSFAAEVDEDGDGEIDFVHTNPRASEENPYLGDCIEQPGWCNDKLIGVVALGHLGNVIMNGSDSNPRSYTGQDGNGHGTHTASTVAGNIVHNVQTHREIDGTEPAYPESFVYDTISGVAPRANIISYKMCGFTGSCDPSYIPEIVDHAIENGVSVINYSISGPEQLPWYHYGAKAFLLAREEGIHVAASAGNTGYGGYKTVQTPGNAPWLTGVAANSHDRGFNQKSITLSGGSENFELESNVLTGEGATQGLEATDVVFAADIEYQAGGTHTHTHSHDNLHESDFIHVAGDHPELTDRDYKDYVDKGVYLHTHVHDNMDSEKLYGLKGSCGNDTLPVEAVQGKVVICNRGGAFDGMSLSRLSKSNVVKQASGSGFILINTDKTSKNIEPDLHAVPGIHLTEKKAKILLNWLAEGEGHQVAFSASQLESNEDSAGLMGAFAAKGPSLFTDNYLIPAISSSGIKVLAAGLGKGMMSHANDLRLTTDADFIYKTGTSMSSPHVAGMYALIQAVHGNNWTPAEAQSALMLTAGTGLKVMGEMVLGEQTYDPAPLHYTGAGMANVDRAIRSGLVMHEDRDGYFAADPYADNPYQRDIEEDGNNGDGYINPEDLAGYEDKVLPKNWHGKPEKMNLASLSMGSCIKTCSWSRVFRATRTASWAVSYSYTTPGMKLSGYAIDSAGNSIADGDVINAARGDEFTLHVTATVVDDLEDSWANGRVHLTPTDSSIPAVSLATAVQFVVGTVPEEINITAHRNVGEIKSDGFISIGSDELNVTGTSLAKAKIYSGHILRNKTPNEIYKAIDESTLLIPVNIPAFSSRFIVEVLETTSPDLDIFVGVDLNQNGYAEYRELDNVHFWSLEQTSLEKLDYFDPRAGTYWIMIHNFGDIFNDEESDSFDPAKVVEDYIKVAVTVVEGTYDNEADGALKVKAPKVAYEDENFAVNVAWDFDMQEHDKVYGSFQISTTENLLGNLGRVKVNINRGQDDVRLSPMANDANDAKVARAGFTLTFAENNTGADITYDLSAELVKGIEVTSFDADNYTLEDNLITWTYTHKSGASSKVLSLILDYANVGGYTDITPIVTSMLVDSKFDEHEQLAKATQPTMIIGSPVFSVEASSLFVMPGEEIVLIADLVDAAIDMPEITYQWQQVAGPEVTSTIETSLYTSTSSLTFTAPDSAKDGITFELVGSNGVRNSQPILTTVFVDSEETSSGGSMSYVCLLVLCVAITRRKLFK